MTSYQRYLRERKESKIEEQDLEEGLKRQQRREANIAAGLHPSGRPLQPGEKLPTKIGQKAAAAGAVSGISANNSTSITPPAELSKSSSSTSLETSPEEVDPSKKTKLDTKPIPTVGKIDPSVIQGETATQILKSAGIKESEIQKVISVFREQARKFNLKTKSGFLS